MTLPAQDLDLLDLDVQQRVETIRPEIVEWTRRQEYGYRPSAGSPLATDDQQAPGMWVSDLAWSSLTTGSEHLMSTVEYLSTMGPTVRSLQSMLRTAIWGGAQAVWLLSPGERSVRVERAALAYVYSKDNYLKWLNTFDEQDPATNNPHELRKERSETTTLVEDLRRKLNLSGRVKGPDQTDVVARVAALIFAEQPEAAVQCGQSWRSLGAVAHALPWELDTRGTREALQTSGGRTTTRVTARWAEIAGELSYAYAFLKKGWSLLDERSHP